MARRSLLFPHPPRRLSIAAARLALAIVVASAWSASAAAQATPSTRAQASNPATAVQAQRELACGHEQVGDLHAKKERHAAALESYQAALAIRTALASRRPRRNQWQRDLISTHLRIGRTLKAQGKLAEARDSLRTALVLTRRLEEEKDPVGRHAGTEMLRHELRLLEKAIERAKAR
jgi:hypothetical protein